jgi:hypothetical protein
MRIRSTERPFSAGTQLARPLQDLELEVAAAGSRSRTCTVKLLRSGTSQVVKQETLVPVARWGGLGVTRHVSEDRAHLEHLEHLDRSYMDPIDGGLRTLVEVDFGGEHNFGYTNAAKRCTRLDLSFPPQPGLICLMLAIPDEDPDEDLKLATLQREPTHITIRVGGLSATSILGGGIFTREEVDAITPQVDGVRGGEWRGGDARLLWSDNLSEIMLPLGGNILERTWTFDLHNQLKFWVPNPP